MTLGLVQADVRCLPPPPPCPANQPSADALVIERSAEYGPHLQALGYRYGASLPSRLTSPASGSSAR